VTKRDSALTSSQSGHEPLENVTVYTECLRFEFTPALVPLAVDACSRRTSVGRKSLDRFHKWLPRRSWCTFGHW